MFTHTLPVATGSNLTSNAPSIRIEVVIISGVD